MHRPDFSPLPSHTLQNWDRSQGCCYNWKKCFVSDLQSRFGRKAVGIGDNNYVCQVYFQKWVLDCLAGEKSLRCLKSMLLEYWTWSSGRMSTDQVLPKNSYFQGLDERQETLCWADCTVHETEIFAGKRSSAQRRRRRVGACRVYRAPLPHLSKVPPGL